MSRKMLSDEDYRGLAVNYVQNMERDAQAKKGVFILINYRGIIYGAIAEFLGDANGVRLLKLKKALPALVGDKYIAAIREIGRVETLQVDDSLDLQTGPTFHARRMQDRLSYLTPEQQTLLRERGLW